MAGRAQRVLGSCPGGGAAQGEGGGWWGAACRLPVRLPLMAETALWCWAAAQEQELLVWDRCLQALSEATPDG